jgi:hypothetical protein
VFYFAAGVAVLATILFFVYRYYKPKNAIRISKFEFSRPRRGARKSDTRIIDEVNTATFMTQDGARLDFGFEEKQKAEKE